MGAAPSKAIDKVIGVSSECNIALSGCRPIAVTVTVLCINSINCPEQLSVDPSNSIRLYGINSPNCVKSINAGVLWSQCISQPPTNGGTLTGIAATKNGTVISVASTASVCTIGRSTNSTVSWSTVYSTGPVCSGDPGQSVVRCVEVTCVIGTNQSSRPGVLISIDDGETWNVGFQSSTKVGIPTTLFFDGINGVIVTNFRDSDNIIYTTSGVNGWTNSPNALGITACYGATFSPSFGLVTICTSGTGIRKLVNVITGVIIDLIIPNLLSDGFPKIIAFDGNHYVTSTVSIPGCGIWATQEAGTNMVQLLCNGAFNTMGGGVIEKWNKNI